MVKIVLPPMNNKQNIPLVSIVIPVYNREALVKEAIDSALKQTYANIEVVVVDNCSTDNTWNVISGYQDSRLRIFQNERNIGPVRNWKRGIELSKGEYIKLLFSDDLISENFIEESIKNFDKDTAFVLSPIQFLRNGIYEKFIPYSKNYYTVVEYFDSFYSHFSEIFPLSPGASIFRKKDIEDSFICDIPTMRNLNPMKNGAGIDLLIYYVVARKYKIIRVAEYSRAIFRAHLDSFSETDTNIVHYYFRAMIYFLPFLNEKKYIDRFKVLLLRYSIFDFSYREEFEMLKTDGYFGLRLVYLLPQYFSNKIWTKIKRKIFSKHSSWLFI